MINIALPKGRLGDQVYTLLAACGYHCDELLGGSRKLEFASWESGVRYFLVKPSDVPIYVERGAADVGIVGKDILLENRPDVYELLDLHIGKCAMCVAAKEGWQEDTDRALKVATTFPRIAKDYYTSLNRDIEVIKLSGSVELAPLLGLADVIVDLVESGSTLRANGLKVTQVIMPISARFIANKSGFVFKRAEIDQMLQKLEGVISDD